MDEELTSLLKEYKQTTEDKNKACEPIDSQIAGLEQQIRALQESGMIISEPFNTKLTVLEAKIKVPMLERKAPFSCDIGKISYRKGAVRRSWNLDALDMICKVSQEIKAAIWEFREEKTGEPSISIKLE